LDGWIVVVVFSARCLWTPRDKNIFSDESFFTRTKKKCCARNARCFDALPNARGDETLHLDA